LEQNRKYPSKSRKQTELLPDYARIAVIGGGPAGSLFAIQTLRKARESGRSLDLYILERKRELHFCQAMHHPGFRDGCNYCAGGISPRLARVLREKNILLPTEVVEGKAETLTVHGDWKSIELPIPEGRDILSVFRGSRPRQRPNRHMNFDSFLLEKAAEEGARIITAEVRDIRYTANQKPLLVYRSRNVSEKEEDTIEADFVVFACGVNQIPGMVPDSGQLFKALKRTIPGFRPPKVRKTVICELEMEKALLEQIRGDVHFILYGSKQLRIEMSSLIPKGNWITLVLLGETVDDADHSRYTQIIRDYMELPHVKRLLPRKATLRPACMCTPNMTVGAVRNPFGHRIALIGDMAVSRLYKDGILSAYLTASALSECILERGIDRSSLRKGYGKVTRQIQRDNYFGRVVFFLNRVAFSHPFLSRIIYQAILTERKTKPRHKRRLANVLWRIASGDDTYRRILFSMFHPATVWLIFAGGLAITVRNYLTERFFGLKWTGFGRYPTGVPKERVEEKRLGILEVLGIDPQGQPLEFEKLYSIRIRADQSRILEELGKFGDKDRKYFRSWLVDVFRTAGKPNEVGATIRYDVFLHWFSFNATLEKVIGKRYLLYRVRDGFAEGGILAFDIEENENKGCLLSIYVAFRFPKHGRPLKRLFWSAFRLFFPAYIHDVLWNNSLCQIKHLVEE